MILELVTGLRFKPFANRTQFDFGTNIAAPAPRNPATELTQSTNALIAAAPGLYALDLQYQPKYAALALSELQTQAPVLQQLSSAQRASDLHDILTFGPAYTAAQLQADPYLAGALNNLSGRLPNSPILDQLNSQAMAALQSGGQLSPQDERDIQQASRAAFSARGMALGDPAVASEILNRDAAIRARQAAAQQFATGVQGLNQAQNQFALAAPGVFTSTIGDPFAAILGRPSQTGLVTTKSSYDPTSGYFSDLYNTNYNAQAAANIASGNNSAALWGAGIKAVGSLAGGAMMASDRRVKKYVKRIGKSPSGFGIYKFQYRGKHKTPTFIGPVAQDVQRKRADAVRELDPFSKIKLVDLRKIDVPVMKVA